MSAKKWIKGAIKHPGAFSAKAKAAGKSTKAFAEANIHASGKLGKQARLAYLLMGLHGGGGARMDKQGDNRGKHSKLYQVG